jgi:hypothetical protein
MNLAAWLALFPPFQRFATTPLSHIDIERRCFAGLFGKDMQHIDGALKPREVEDPILATCVYTNFLPMWCRAAKVVTSGPPAC